MNNSTSVPAGKQIQRIATPADKLQAALSESRADQNAAESAELANINGQLDNLAQQIADDQAAIEAQVKDMRFRVIRMGRHLLEMQKIQKAVQAETGQTWDQWIEEQRNSRGTFPAVTTCRRCVLIAKYPGACESGMSIKEGYREAGRWKANGGNPPLPLKTTIKARPLVTIGAAAAKLDRKIETLNEQEFSELASEQQWTEDEILGATDSLTVLRQSCDHMLRNLKQAHNRMLREAD